MLSVGEVEIDAVAHFLNVDGLLVGVVLQDQLLQEEERAPVVYLLAQLHDGLPRVFRRYTVAILACEVLDDVLHHEGLLQDGAREDLLLHGQLGLDPLGVRLRPHERGVDQLDLAQPAQPLDADGEQLARLPRAGHPGPRRLQVAVAAAAALHALGLRDAAGDVHLRSDAVDAHPRGVRLHAGAAQRAEHAAGRQLLLLDLRRHGLRAACW